MLVVDKNIDTSLREQAEWLNHGISTVRVDTMREAIEKLTKEPFLLSAINADNVSYLPLLKTMRITAPTFICIIASNYTTEREVEALHNGADVFTQFNGNVKLNVQLALAQLLRCKERDTPPKVPPGMTVYENFLVLSNARRIFYNDEKIKLTKKEYELLYYFITNHDLSLSYQKIYRKIWSREIDEASRKLLLNFIDKLRKKITKASGGRNYFINEREQGYTFSANADK